MNEHIKRLVKRAGGHFDTHCLASNPVQYKEFIQLWDEHIEKFAELIVRECADKIERDYKYERRQTAQWITAFGIANDLKEHFGVE